MKVRISNYDKLISNFIKKSEIADEKSLFKLSSKYYSLAQKLYKFATSELDESIDRNKNTIRANNRKAIEELLLIPETEQWRIDYKKLVESNKDEIINIFDSIEFPYDLNFGDTSRESARQNLYELFLFSLKLSKKGVAPDLVLAMAHRRQMLGNQIFASNSERYPSLRNIEFIEDEKIKQVFEVIGNTFSFDGRFLDQEEAYFGAYAKFLESRKELYGFINDRRMEFRTPTLLLDIYLNLYRNFEVPILSANRKEFLDLMYAETRENLQINTVDFPNFDFDMEHFHSALNFNYIFGKNSISFLNQCHEESAGNHISDIPHFVDNELALYGFEYAPNLGQFIISNYFKVNERRAVEDWVKKQLPAPYVIQSPDKIKYISDLIMDPANESVGVDAFGSIVKKKDCVRDARIKIRTAISLVATNWNRTVRINNEEKIVKDIANRPLEQLNKIIEQDIIADDIGTKNIRNWKLFDAMLEYQKNDIKKFLKVQFHTEISKESDWYEELCKHKVENESYIGRFLPKKDPRFPFVGAISGCCQKVNGHGENAFENTFEENSGVFVVTDKKDKIVSQSYVWTNDFTISLDSIESQHENINKNDFKNIYDKACEELFSKYFDVVLCGSNNTNTFLTNQNDRFIPLDLYPNNDSKTYTYDTSSGRSVMWSDPSSTFPFITVFQKSKNFLNEPFDEDEINFLQNNLKLAVKICNDLVTTFVNQVDQNLNANNVLRFYSNMTSLQSSTYDDIPFVWLCKILRGGPYDFDRNMNEEQFHISLNMWLFDGGLKHLKIQGPDEQLDQEYEIIELLSEAFGYTNLYKTQKLLYAPKNEIDKVQDFSNLFSESQQPYKDQIMNTLADNISFKDLMQKVDISKGDDLYVTTYGQYFNFLPILISKYLQKRKFNVEDMKLALNINIFDEFRDIVDENDQIIKPTKLLIENGILDYLYEFDENFDFIAPDFSAVRRIKVALEDGDIDKSKIVNFTEKFFNTITSADIYYNEDADVNNNRMGRNIKFFLEQGYYTPDYNEKEIQNIFKKYEITLKGLDAKINRIYLSTLNVFTHAEGFLEDTIHLILDTMPNTIIIDTLKIIILFRLTKKIIIDVENPNYLTLDFINETCNKKILFEIKSEDVLNTISNYLGDDSNLKEMMIKYKYYDKEETKIYKPKFTNFVLSHIKSKFWICPELPVSEELLLDLISKKVDAYFNWARQYFNNFDENTKEMIQNAMDNTPETTPIPNGAPPEPTPEPILEPAPEQDEEQRNRNSSSRKNIKYSLKRK